MRKLWIYLVGIVVAGLAYVQLKSMLTEPVFFVVMIFYLILLRLLAERFGK